MWLIAKRLALGLALIALTSSVLLLSDLRSRRSARAEAAARPQAGKVLNLALLQHASQPVLDDGVRGMIEGLQEKGFAEGGKITLRRFNAEGDMPTANTIARDITGGKYDLVLTASTLSLQAVAGANVNQKTRHVFALVSDPYGAGVGISREDPLNHPPYLAGYGTMQPVEDCFRIARELYPGLKTVGVVWNPAESNSEAQLKVARKACQDLGITLMEATVDNSSGVFEAANAVVSRGAEALWAPGDVAVLGAFGSVVQAANKARIPVFTVIPPHAERGALFDVGANYHEVGKLAGHLAAEILEGRDPATVPIENVIPEVLVVNKLALKDLKDAWRLPDSVLERATTVIDESGKRTRTTEAPGSAAVAGTTAVGAGARPPPGKTFRIGLAYYAPEGAIDMTINGLFAGLKALGFEEGKNLVVMRSHAQGEMINIPGMLQHLDASDADVLVTLTTPVLQAACFGVKRKPVVFTCVTDPIAAGAGKSWTDHYAHVTGVGSFPPLEETMELIPRLIPGLRTLGTLYNSGEANSAKIVTVLRELTARKGIRLVELTAANSGEVLQAAQGLTTRQVQAIYLPSDNTVYQALDAIMKVADTARLPVINDDADYLSRGMLASMGPGYFESGRATAPLVARVLLGESPANIPMTNVSVNITRFNPQIATKLGLKIPAALVREIEAAAKPAAAPVVAAARGRPAGLPPVPSKKWKLSLIELNDVPAIEESSRGILAGLAESGLVLGTHYEVKRQNAQGEIGTLNAIADNAVADNSDLVLVVSTLALQTALRKIQDRPIVFAQVTDPIKAGAGRSATDHLPHVTGSTPLSDHRKMIAVIRQCLPGVRRIATLFNPSEDNSVIQKDELTAAARAAGIEVDRRHQPNPRNRQCRRRAVRPETERPLPDLG